LIAGNIVSQLIYVIVINQWWTIDRWFRQVCDGFVKEFRVYGAREG